MAKQTHTAEEAEKKFQSLPPEVKALLYSDEMFNVIKQIGEKHQLHIDQIGSLETETGQVMLGFVDTKEFPTELANILSIDKTQADAIAQDINETFFVKIRDAMKKTSSMSTTSEKSVVMPSKMVPMGSEIKPVSTMPSSAPAPTMPKPVTPAPATTPVPAAMPIPKPPMPVSTPPKSFPAQKPAPDLSKADMMLSQSTVSMPKEVPSTPVAPVSTAPMTPARDIAPAPAPAKIDPAKPNNYKADPYREPVE